MNESRKNWLEWGVFAAGCVLVSGVVGYLAYDAWKANRSPPEIEVRVGRAESRAGHYALPVTVVNRGERSAEQVHVEVVLRTKDGRQERAGFQIAYLPRRGSREGWVTFQTDPAGAEQIVARPLGYAMP